MPSNLFCSIALQSYQKALKYYDISYIIFSCLIWFLFILFEQICSISALDTGDKQKVISSLSFKNISCVEEKYSVCAWLLMISKWYRRQPNPITWRWRPSLGGQSCFSLSFFCRQGWNNEVQRLSSLTSIFTGTHRLCPMVRIMVLSSASLP